MTEAEQRIDSKLAMLEHERGTVKKDKEKMTLYMDRVGMELEDRMAH